MKTSHSLESMSTSGTTSTSGYSIFTLKSTLPSSPSQNSLSGPRSQALVLTGFSASHSSNTVFFLLNTILYLSPSPGSILLRFHYFP